jgi:hypothetical protein
MQVTRRKTQILRNPNYRTMLHGNLKAESQITYKRNAVRTLADKLQGILELLCDGKRHSLYELQVAAQLSESQTRATVEFLTEYGFTELIGNDEVRITPNAKMLMETRA